MCVRLGKVEILQPLRRKSDPRVVIHWISWHLRASCISFNDSPWMINYPQNCMFSPLCTAFLICASFFSFQTSAWSERDTRRKTRLPGLPSPWEKYQLISLSHRITRSCSSNTSVESIGKQLRFDFICIVMRTAGPLNMLIILLFPKISSKEHNSIHEAQQEAMVRCKNPKNWYSAFHIPCQVFREAAGFIFSHRNS